MKSHIRSNWRTALLICKKCTKKVGGGFGPKGRTSLAKVLKAELGGGRKRKADIGIIETKCLGVCPNHAVTMIDGRNSGSWLLIRPGTDVREIVAKLDIPADGNN